MIGLDTNVLARYYVQDESDQEATGQHEAARWLIESGKPLMVAQIVLLELEWVMRGYYDFSTEQVAAVLRHLLSLPQVTIESYHDCEHVASFDDRKFARRAKRLQLLPHVAVPT